MGEPPSESTPARIGFRADLVSATLALIHQPSVPFLSLAPWLLLDAIPKGRSSLPHEAAQAWVVLFCEIGFEAAFTLFVPGWFGVERIFFQRHFEGRPVRLPHLLRLVKPFVGRFLALGVPFAIVVLTFVFALGGLVGIDEFHRPESALEIPLSFLLPLATFFFVMDFVLTFVPPALAYTTRSVTEALNIGVGMIRQTWPRSALYLLCPPLALNVLHNIFPAGGLVARLAVTCIVILVGLVAKGAIAAFYLRERGSYSEDGAAYISTRGEAVGSIALTTPIRHGQA